MEKSAYSRSVKRRDISMKDKLTYATHGEKKPLGQMVIINGKRSVAFVDKDNTIRSYTTVDEINDLFCKEKVRECDLDF